MEGEAVTLPPWQFAKRVDETQMIVATSDLFIDAVGVEIVHRLPVPQRQKATTIVVTGQIQNDRSEVRSSFGPVINSMEGPVQSNERLLHDVFSSVTMIDEKACEVHQRSRVLVEQVDEHPIGVCPIGRNVTFLLEVLFALN